jgi:rhodanese-related sulfurtransferase
MRNVFFTLLFFSLLSCKGQAPAAKMKPEEFSAATPKTGVQVFDVRTVAEYNSGHIAGALQADWTNQPQFLDRVQHLDKNKPVYVYCLAGGRSNAAANWMRTNGFTTVVELEGGINAWKANNKPLEGKSDEPQMTLEQYKASIPTDKTTLVDFGAKWCPPCVKMEPVLKEVQESAGKDFMLLKIDAGVHTNLMQALGISPIPVFIVYKNGKETWRKEGIISKEELLEELK